MKKIIRTKKLVFSSNDGYFKIEDLLKIASPSEVLEGYSSGWDLHIYRIIEREETQEEYGARLRQEEKAESEELLNYLRLKEKFEKKL